MVTVTEVPREVSSGRLSDLVEGLGDEHFVLGPIDQRDVRAALIELLARRNADEILSAAAPLVSAA